MDRAAPSVRSPPRPAAWDLQPVAPGVLVALERDRDRAAHLVSVVGVPQGRHLDKPAPPSRTGVRQRQGRRHVDGLERLLTLLSQNTRGVDHHVHPVEDCLPGVGGQQGCQVTGHLIGAQRAPLGAGQGPHAPTVPAQGRDHEAAQKASAAHDEGGAGRLRKSHSC